MDILIPDGLWPSPLHPGHGVCMFALAESSIQSFFWQLEIEVDHTQAMVGLQAWNTSVTVAAS